MAKENIIIDKTFEFSLRIIDLYKYLTIKKKEYILSKMSIASKEARETIYWLRLLIKSDYIIDDGIINNSIEIRKIIISIVQTTSAQKI